MQNEKKKKKVMEEIELQLITSMKRTLWSHKEDEKTKGQAAVEVIGGRAGKAGASSINYVLTNVVAVGSKISAHLYTIIPIFAVTVIGWIMAVFGLNKQYTAKIAKFEPEGK